MYKWEFVTRLKDEARFGDPWVFNMTAVYYGSFSPDEIAVQLVQNFLVFFVSTMFWLSYIPFYERLFPIFINKNETDEAEEENKLNYMFSMDKFEQRFFGGSGQAASTSKEFKVKGKTIELSFGRFAKLLRAFADFIEGIQR